MAPLDPKDLRAVELGEWLMAKRLARGLKRPEAVRIALQHDPRAALSPDYLSKLEYGARSLASAALDVREALRAALAIKPEEWEQATGLIVPGFEPEPEPQRLLPPGLMDAVAQYGDKYAALRKPKVQEQLAATRHWDGGPKDADSWLEFWLLNKRFIREE